MYSIDQELKGSTFHFGSDHLGLSSELKFDVLCQCHREICGRRILDANGSSLSKVHDVLLDPDFHEPKYVIFRIRESILSGYTELIAYPMREIREITKDHLLIGHSKHQILHSLEFDLQYIMQTGHFRSLVSLLQFSKGALSS